MRFLVPCLFHSQEAVEMQDLSEFGSQPGPNRKGKILSVQPALPDASVSPEFLASLWNEMLLIIARRSADAASNERSLIIAWCAKHPNMPLRLAASFIALGEHLR